MQPDAKSQALRPKAGAFGKVHCEETVSNDGTGKIEESESRTMLALLC
ncbi:hypothetical protein BMS3Bbin06_00565 [bacterium BMS3Bbin06]|nr:hypothetical protein BMS3Abin08_02304 [bacterium BMS3Abin08]GBE34049.1 hypothetical protein BMS3Bbin06_00565 [bacterium BMS3Bbin06]